MAGVKGRSGGARPGSGRKPKAPTVLQMAGQHEDPEAFLRAVMNDVGADAKLRLDAAKALMPFVHAKKGTGAKEPEKPSGRFAAKKGPPQLVVSNG